MNQFHRSKHISVDADRVFEFVTTPENMPQFLPTIEKATYDGSDQILLEGCAEGHPFRTVGEFHLDPDERMMHWDTKGPRKYRGQLRVTPADKSTSTLSVELTFEQTEPADVESSHGSKRLESALEETLERIKRICEGANALRGSGDWGYIL